MLLAAGLPLPRTVFGHGFVNMGGDRMSKSSGLVTDPEELARIYGPDAIRYYLCSEAAFGQDLSWSEERLKVVVNTELSNGLGNLASRVVSMIVKYRGGDAGSPPEDSAYLRQAREAVAAYREAMERLDLRAALQAAMGIVALGNVHVDRTQPFTLAKDPSRARELEGVLSELARGLLIASRLLFPFMPGKASALHRELTGEGIDPASAVLTATDAVLPAGRVLSRPAPLFPRLE